LYSRNAERAALRPNKPQLANLLTPRWYACQAQYPTRDDTIAESMVNGVVNLPARQVTRLKFAKTTLATPAAATAAADLPPPIAKETSPPTATMQP
jgi:hypothetical protein